MADRRETCAILLCTEQTAGSQERLELWASHASTATSPAGVATYCLREDALQDPAQWLMQPLLWTPEPVPEWAQTIAPYSSSLFEQHRRWTQAARSKDGRAAPADASEMVLPPFFQHGFKPEQWAVLKPHLQLVLAATDEVRGLYKWPRGATLRWAGEPAGIKPDGHTLALSRVLGRLMAGVGPTVLSQTYGTVSADEYYASLRRELIANVGKRFHSVQSYPDVGDSGGSGGSGSAAAHFAYVSLVSSDVLANERQQHGCSEFLKAVGRHLLEHSTASARVFLFLRACTGPDRRTTYDWAQLHDNAVSAVRDVEEVNTDVAGTEQGMNAAEHGANTGARAVMEQGANAAARAVVEIAANSFRVYSDKAPPELVSPTMLLVTLQLEVVLPLGQRLVKPAVQPAAESRTGLGIVAVDGTRKADGSKHQRPATAQGAANAATTITSSKAAKPKEAAAGSAAGQSALGASAAQGATTTGATATSNKATKSKEASAGAVVGMSGLAALAADAAAAKATNASERPPNSRGGGADAHPLPRPAVTVIDLDGPAAAPSGSPSMNTVATGIGSALAPPNSSGQARPLHPVAPSAPPPKNGAAPVGPSTDSAPALLDAHGFTQAVARALERLRSGSTNAPKTTSLETCLQELVDLVARLAPDGM